ncbi:MAG TPA: hypothetical protein DCY88_29870 [Cyanobacteria bacterium UBA11372]|nr:hypothetical protein [Cyanobacteria bacterium UBA11372]
MPVEAVWRGRETWVERLVKSQRDRKKRWRGTGSPCLGTAFLNPPLFRRGSCQKDIDAAYNYLTQELKIPPNRIIAYGFSVGGGPSVDLAARKPIAGLIVENTFITAFRVVTHIPIVPFDKFANIDKIKNVRCPVLVMHATADEVIPFYHGQKLFAAAKEPKRFLPIEGAGHNNLRLVAGERYVKALREFVELVSNQ